MTETISRRSAILKATIDEVVKNGLDGTSIHKVAEAAGVSTGLVMYHFKTKEELDDGGMDGVRALLLHALR